MPRRDDPPDEWWKDWQAMSGLYLALVFLGAVIGSIAARLF